MKRNFVTFYSPGTFFAEQTTKEIDEWNVNLAIEMSKEITERHGATPYGFQFNTQEQKDGEWGIVEVAKSPFYWLGGDVFTVEELEKIGNPNDYTLIMNMKNNKWNRVIVNNNSWQWTQPLRDGDVVLKI